MRILIYLFPKNKINNWERSFKKSYSICLGLDTEYDLAQMKLFLLNESILLYTINKKTYKLFLFPSLTTYFHPQKD